MTDLILYIVGGLSAGLLAGYLGLGGGIVIVPFLTVIAGVDIKVAVPVSVTAIVVNSFTSSNEYLKKGMIDFELVIILSLFLVMGSILGSSLMVVVPVSYSRMLLTVILIYTAFSLLKNKKISDQNIYNDNRKKYLLICIILSFITGILAGIIGIGGGVIIVPILYLFIGLPLTTARGTSSFMIGFSAAAASVVYFFNGMIDYKIASGVILGIIIGGKLGGYFGTRAKPFAVKVLFFIIMLYLAFKLSYESLIQIL